MSTSAEHANRFLQELAALASRLADRNVVISRLQCEWAHFGSWVLEAQKGAVADAYGEALLAEKWDTSGPEVLRVSWDGRERFLTIQKGLTAPLSNPVDWTLQTEQAFEDASAAI